MTLAERARIMARRKELYVEKYPEAKNGIIQRARPGNSFQAPVSSFFAATAEATGKGQWVVNLDDSRGTGIVEVALTLVTRTPLDNARYLDTLKRAPKAEQVERVRRDLSDPPTRTKPTADAAYLAWIEEGQRWNAAMPYYSQALHAVTKTCRLTPSHGYCARGARVAH